MRMKDILEKSIPKQHICTRELPLFSQLICSLPKLIFKRYIFLFHFKPLINSSLHLIPIFEKLNVPRKRTYVTQGNIMDMERKRLDEMILLPVQEQTKRY